MPIFCEERQRVLRIFGQRHQAHRQEGTRTKDAVHSGIEQEGLDAVAVEEQARDVRFHPRRVAGEFDQAQAVPPTVRPSMSKVG